MKIPKQIKVGTTTYRIDQPPQIKLDNGDEVMGRISYGLKRIQVATKYPAAEQRNTFWHELTHAILQDMGHELCDNERFVIAFSNRLSDAIDSAKF